MFFKVEKRLNEESERAKHYLDPSTEKPITEVRCILNDKRDAYGAIVGVLTYTELTICYTSSLQLSTI